MPQTSFERLEYKYWVPERLTAELLALISQHLYCDDWAKGGQRNTSLYLDSPELDFLNSHTESAPDRCKLRVRAYGDPPTEPAFFEVKRKVKRTSLKHRAAVPFAELSALLSGEIRPRVQLKSLEERRTLEHFLYLMLTYHAAPKVLVTCRREAFTSIDPGDGVRLTLDRDIHYQPARGHTLIGDPRAWTPLCGQEQKDDTSGATLLEIKCRGAAPWWVADLVQRLRLTLTSYSKYVTAMALNDLGAGAFFEADLEQDAICPAERES